MLTFEVLSGINKVEKKLCCSQIIYLVKNKIRNVLLVEKKRTMVGLSTLTKPFQQNQTERERRRERERERERERKKHAITLFVDVLNDFSVVDP